MGSLDPADGGPSSSVPKILMSACRAGIRVSCAVPDTAPESAGQLATFQELAAEGVELHIFPVFRRMPKFKRWGVSLSLALWVLRSAKDFDIIQGHGAWTFGSMLGFLVSRLGGAAFVLVPHESLVQSDVMKGSNPLRHRIKKFVKSLYVNHCDLIIFASHLEQRDSLDVGALVASACIFHPMVKDESPPLPSRKWASALPVLNVGFLGRFDPKKNLELLLRAVSLVPSAILHVAGGGAESYIRRLHALAAEYGVADRVRWLGFISAATRPEFFLSVDVLVMPSVYECFGMSAAEAMYHGLPVIVSEQTGIAEIVRRYECGLIVPTNSEAIRVVLQQLYTNPARLTAFSARTLEAVRTELTFSHYGERLAALYHDILTRRK